MAKQTTQLESDKRPLPPTNHPSDDPTLIRAQIEKTRHRMSEDINELQERLSPENVKQQTQEAIREATIGKVEDMANSAEYRARRMKRSTIRTIKENPVPAAMIGLGLGWLLFSGNDDDDYEYGYDYEYDYENAAFDSRYGEPYTYRPAPVGNTYNQEDDRDPIDDIQERAAGAARQARRQVDQATTNAQEQISDTVDSVRESVSDATTQTQQYISERSNELQRQGRRQMRRTKRTFWESMEENPLAVGISAMAAGALIGLALPSTEKENEWMGETSDQLMEEVRSTANETARKTQKVAEKAANTAVTEAKKEAKKEANKQDLPTPSSGKSRPSA